MSSKECMQRYLLDVYDDGDESSWIWPKVIPKDEDTKLLVAIMLEIAIKFFFANFLYTFGGESFLQGKGGPIGARITMCIARLVMQDWWEKFSVKLKSASLEELLRAIYVDDGRMIMRKLQLGMRYVDGATEVFKFDEKWLAEDTDNGLSRDAVTLREVGNLMNSISADLTFTTEIETDFSKGRLPTLAFELWSEKEGLRHSYFEKNMRSQLMTMKRSSQSEHSKFSILVNELSRRFEVLDD